MHWTFTYFGKLAAQRVLGAVPNGFLVQELVKRASRRQDRYIAGEYLMRRLQQKIARFNAAGIEPPETVVEQGTGWLGFDLVLFHLGGAHRIFTYDTTPWLRTELLGRSAEFLTTATDVLKRWRGIDPARVDERAERLRHSLGTPGATLLERLGTTVRVTRSMERAGLDPQSIDLFYSDSVLQFLEPGELAALIREARRFLKSSGRCFHVIDCVDHQRHDDAPGSRLAYLSWSEPTWRLMTSKYLNYQNRLRMPQFVNLFESEGMASRVIDPVVDAQDVAYVKRRFAGDPRFEKMSMEEVATRSFGLIGTVT